MVTSDVVNLVSITIQGEGSLIIIIKGNQDHVDHNHRLSSGTSS